MRKAAAKRKKRKEEKAAAKAAKKAAKKAEETDGQEGPNDEGADAAGDASESAEPAKLEPEQDPEDAATHALRVELLILKMKQLQKRAEEIGVDEALLEEAEESDTPKHNIVELIVAATLAAEETAAAAGPDEANQQQAGTPAGDPTTAPDDEVFDIDTLPCATTLPRTLHRCSFVQLTKLPQAHSTYQ